MDPKVSRQRLDLIDAVSLIDISIQKLKEMRKTLERGISVIEETQSLIENSGHRILSSEVFKTMRSLQNIEIQ